MIRFWKQNNEHYMSHSSHINATLSSPKYDRRWRPYLCIENFWGLGIKWVIYCCLSFLASSCPPLFFDFARAILAGFERSDCENWIRICISAVTTAKPKAENATPFQEESNEDHCRNFTDPATTRHAQDITTCSQHEIHGSLGKHPWLDRKE